MICNDSFLTHVLAEACCCNFGVTPNYDSMKNMLREVIENFELTEGKSNDTDEKIVGAINIIRNQRPNSN